MLIKKIPYNSDTTKYYEQIRQLDWPVFFDSCYQADMKKSPYARYDIISADPFIKIYSDSNIINIHEKKTINALSKFLLLNHSNRCLVK